ncbi:MAG: ABC transporter substrate-binding protein [Thermodesulfobacteriota bacterium]
MSKRYRIWTLVVAVTAFASLVTGFTSTTLGLEKMKVGSSVKLSPMYNLPFATAEEQGFWKQNGLDAELVTFKGGAKLYQGIVAGAVNMGMSMAASELQARASGVPVIIVFNLNDSETFAFWVRSDSRRKKPKDVKGAKIGVMRLAGSAHAYGRMVVKELGLQKEVKFISAGGIRSSIALLRAGKTDIAVHPYHQLVKLLLKGDVRRLLKVDDYRPSKWTSYIITANQGFVKKSPDIARRVVKAMLQASKFIRGNRGWTSAKLKQMFGFSDKAAGLVYEHLQFSRDGRISPEGLANLSKFLIDFGIVPADKMPPVDELYTKQFTG